MEAVQKLSTVTSKDDIAECFLWMEDVRLNILTVEVVWSGNNHFQGQMWNMYGGPIHVEDEVGHCCVITDTGGQYLDIDLR